MLRYGDKLDFPKTRQNWVELPHLLSFVRMADFVTAHLGDALSSAGLTLTQAMICSELATWKMRSTPGTLGLSLTDISRRLAAPRARIHAQLKELLAMGVVRATEKSSSNPGRGPRYALTSKGLRRHEVFAEKAESACAEVAWVFFHHGQKRHDAWVQMSGLLTKHLAGDADAT